MRAVDHIRFIRLLLPVLFLTLPACGWDGQLRFLGYSTQPNYNTNIRTVHVPIFKNITLQRGLEFDLTRAVIREIEAKTPYKVVGLGQAADTELSGTIINVSKGVTNRNQLNEIRDAETVVGVQVIWRDVRTGEVLSRPRPLPGAPPAPPDAKPEPVLVTSTANFIPELGESITSAQKKNVDRLAVQIVSMMECAW